jgi:hypothetical protein
MNADKDPDIVFRSTLYLMDIERVRFSLNRYLRTRLKKIEEQLDFVVSTASALDCLGHREREFAFELHALNERYMDDSFLDKLANRQAAEGGEERVRHAQPQIEVQDMSISMSMSVSMFMYVCVYVYVCMCLCMCLCLCLCLCLRVALECCTVLTLC